MSRYCCYELRGWEADGNPLSSTTRDEVESLLDELDVDDINTIVPDDSSCIASFTTQTQCAAGNVHDALSAFASSHPNLLLELEFLCQEDDIHSRIRFQNEQSETVDAVVVFPPFQTLHVPVLHPWTLTDDETLQHIRFLGDRRYECIDIGRKPNEQYFVCRRIIDLNDYEMDESFVDDYLRPYSYGSLAVLQEEYGDAADQIIAECILETEMWEQQEMIHAGTEDDCRTFILRYIG